MAASQSNSMTFTTYHWENLLLKGQANWLPAVGGFLATVLRLLGNLALPDTGGDELLFLVPVERADSRADAAGATHARPRPAGRFGTLRTLLCHLQGRLWLAGVGERSLCVGHWLASWRHGGNGAASEDSGAGADGDGGVRTVMVAEGGWVVFWGESKKKKRITVIETMYKVPPIQQLSSTSGYVTETWATLVTAAEAGDKNKQPEWKSITAFNTAASQRTHTHDYGKRDMCHYTAWWHLGK